jgi:hypothetical protein
VATEKQCPGGKQNTGVYYIQPKAHLCVPCILFCSLLYACSLHLLASFTASIERTHLEPARLVTSVARRDETARITRGGPWFDAGSDSRHSSLAAVKF